MKTPIHSIHIDFSHSSEAKLLHKVLLDWVSPMNPVEEDNFLCDIIERLESNIELLESLEA